jgi:glycosyltransferase involved in cell wall biosynthesis
MKVSVLINNYNYGRFLDDCLQSLKNQTSKPFEVILYDDGSADDSLEIARKYDFVKVISNKNYGKKPAFNQGNAIYQAFLVSKGDIICLLDSDDFFLKTKLAQVIDAFLSDTNAVLVQNALFEWRENNITKTLNYGVCDKNYLQLYQKENWTSFFNPTSCLSFKRNYLEKVLPIVEDSNWKVWPDVRLSRIAPYYGNVVTLDSPLTYYRKHGNSDSDNMNKNHRKILENQIAHHKYVNLEIENLGKKPLKYKRNIHYMKFYIKSILPNSFINLLKILNK